MFLLWSEDVHIFLDKYTQTCQNEHFDEQNEAIGVRNETTNVTLSVWNNEEIVTMNETVIERCEFTQ